MRADVIARSEAIGSTVAAMKAALASGVDTGTLRDAKAHLLDLAARDELFPFSAFPLPEGDAVERTYLLHQEAGGGIALYVNAAGAAQSYGPHDHGNSWAIVVAVRGREKHCFYKRRDDGKVAGRAEIEETGSLVVEPGTGIAMVPGAIHAIEAFETAPLLHLHCYARPFESMANRREFDLAAGTYRYNNDVGVIEMPPGAG